MVEVGRDKTLELLAAAPRGRVVFSDQGLPAIRPVNFLVAANGDIVIRTHADDAALPGRAYRLVGSDAGSGPVTGRCPRRTG
ncbi:pyridoxamine 5'-phosphate oxidase family protein [Streptomyces sp. NPDC058464]|uniref:pyridoxamine 5'-phosphate oxidase family protein n=1 Tax=Streptomyces sp. NPDC058464 TaxID=3346511 RepID=UPI003647F546